MSSSFINELIRTFRIIAFLGFLAAGVMATAAIYKLLAKHFPEKFEKKRWPFIPIAAVVLLILLTRSRYI